MKAELLTVAAASGLVSAALWLWSARVAIPDKPIWFQAYVGGGGPNPEVERLTAALRRQSRLNAWAAVMAAVSVAAQAVVAMLDA